MKKEGRKKKGIVIIAALAILLISLGTADQAIGQYVCFPTCNVWQEEEGGPFFTDGRFLSIAGSGLSTLASQTLNSDIRIKKKLNFF